MNRARCLRFATFEFDLDALELTRDGRKVPLSPQPARLLELLLTAQGELVTRDQMRECLWPNQTVVDFDQGINSCLRQIRSALGDQADSPRFVATVPRRGARFLADVAPVGTAKESDSKPSHALWWGLGIGLILGAFLLGRGSQTSDPVPADDGRARLAVLPLENFTGDPTLEYLCDGLTEEMIARLAALDPSRLAVIARTSVMGYRGGSATVAEIAEQLNVDYVLEGSVRGTASNLRIAAQLVAATDASHVWVDSFDSELADLFAVQGNIARRVAASLESELLIADSSALQGSSTENADAYDQFLRGRVQWSRFDAAGLSLAVKHFDSAIELDPLFARAWAAKAEALSLFAFQGLLPEDESYPLARAAAERALELDPQQSLAHNALGFIRLYYDWDIPGADAAFRRALEIDPGYAMAHHWYAAVLSVAGRHDEAVAEVLLAEELDPLSLSVRSDLAWYYAYADRWAEAIEAARRTLDVDPWYDWARGALIIAALRAGQAELAEAEMRVIAEQENWPGSVRDAEDFVPAAWDYRVGNRSVDELKSNAFGSATILAMVGREDEAIDLLEVMVDRRDGWSVFLGVDPRLDRLHGNPRFRSLLERIGVGQTDPSPQ